MSSILISDPASAVKEGLPFKPDTILIELQPQHVPGLLELRDVFGAIPLAKPAAPQELIARLGTALRRARQN